MAQKGITLINKQIRIREFYPVETLRDKTFEDVAHELYGKLLLESKSIQSVIQDRGNLIDNEERAGLIKFFYLEDGIETPITKAEYVLDVYMATGKREILFFVDVIGGKG